MNPRRRATSGGRRCVGVVLAVAAVTLCAGSAHAGNRLNYFQGSQAAMTGAAVTAIGHDAGAFWYNPAGLGANDRDRLDLNGSAFSLSRRRIPNAITLRTPDNPDGTTRDLVGNDFGIVAPALIFVRRLSKDMSLGVGMVVSQQRARSFEADISYDALERFFGAEQGKDGSVAATRLRYVEQMQRQHIGAAWGWQVLPRLRLGASAFFVNQTQLETTQAATTSSVRTEGLVRSYFEQFTSAYEQKSRGVEGTLGAQWQPIEALHIGLAVRSPAWRISGKRTDEYAGLEGTQQSEVVGAAAGYLLKEDEAELSKRDQRLTPMRITLGLAWEGDDWWIGADVDYEYGYLFLERDERFVEYEYDPEADEYKPMNATTTAVWAIREMVNARVGGQYRLNDTVELGVGLYTDKSPTPIRSGFPETDIDYYGGTLGVKLTTPVRLAREEHAPTIKFATTIAARYAYGRGVGFQREEDFTGSDAYAFGPVSHENAVIVEAHDISVFLGSTLVF